MALTPGDPVVGGSVLRRPAIQSPNFIAGVQGWAINADGTAEFNELILVVQTSSAGILIYNGSAGLGNLIGSWSAVATVDSFGNTVPAGLFATQGELDGMSMTNSQIINAFIQNSLLTDASIQNATMTGGTITETVIQFDTTAGGVFGYATTTTTVTQTANGSYQFTVPGGVNSGDITMTGAGEGGGGGDNGSGGNGGGAGETAREPNYPLTPGDVIDYVVGNGGGGSATGGGPGDSGGDSFFDVSNGGVFAHGGGGTVPGQPGTGSTNSIHHDGGTGGSASGTGGGGGAGSGGQTGAGGNGTNNAGSGTAAGGAAGTGGGAAGGQGGANSGNGSNGAAPGAGGGGAGAGSGTTSFNKTYTATATHSYQGSDAGNGLINSNGNAYQGGNVGNTFNGKAKTWIVFNHSQIASDAAGVSLTSTSLKLNNNHTWYNSGMTVCVGWDTETSFGSTKGNPSGGNIDSHEYHTNEGSTTTEGIPGLGTALKNGTAFNVVLFKNSNSLTYYGYFAGKNQSGPPQLILKGTSGGAAQNSGTGADGKAVISYTSAASLVFSLAAVAGTDSFGNAYPAGLMIKAGTLVAIDPVNGGAETWHSLGTFSHIGLNSAAYRMSPDGELELDFRGTTDGSNAATVTGSVTLPAAYRPTGTNRRQPIHTGRAITAGETMPFVQVTTAGAVQINVNAANITVTVDFLVRFRLDEST